MDKTSFYIEVMGIYKWGTLYPAYSHSYTDYQDASLGFLMEKTV